MTTIDWSRPIVTNAGKPARAESEAHGVARKVLGEFSAGISWRWVNEDTGKAGHGFGVRNATPTEILTHPEVWPEWQDWARENAMMMQGPATYAKANPQPIADIQPVTHESILASIKSASTPRPITYAAVLTAVERLPEHLDGSAAIADALCNALGVDVPVKGSGNG